MQRGGRNSANRIVPWDVCALLVKTQGAKNDGFIQGSTAGRKEYVFPQGSSGTWACHFFQNLANFSG